MFLRRNNKKPESLAAFRKKCEPDAYGLQLAFCAIHPLVILNKKNQGRSPDYSHTTLQIGDSGCRPGSKVRTIRALICTQLQAYGLIEF